MQAQNLRQIRRKIRAIQGLQKIARAMQLVSAAKFKKAQDRLFAIRPFSDKISELVGNVGHSPKANHPLLQSREEIKNTGFVLIMADKGLCGSYNSNLIKNLHEFLQKAKQNIKFFAFGKKAIDYLAKKKFEIVFDKTRLRTDISMHDIKSIVNEIVSFYVDGKVDEVFILYTRFVNPLTHLPTLEKFLPIEKQEQQQEEYIFEPEPEKFIPILLPRYIQIKFLRILLESFTSEHAARMNAMKQATDNAERLIDEMTLIYNKVRQTQITRELLDIVVGKEAIEGKYG
jgi:F-type H+-transporting ATPase subunit gamma